MTRPRSLRRHRFAVLLTAVALVMALPATAALGAPPQPRPSTAPSSPAKTNPSSAPKTHARSATKAAPRPSGKVRKPTKPVRVRPGRPRLSDPPPQADFSGAQPQTMRDDITGDFGGLGFDQRMRVETGALNRWLPPDQGGTLTSVPTDLEPAPPAVGFTVGSPGNTQKEALSDRAEFGSERYQNCPGCFNILFDYYHIDTVYLATMDGYVYILGTKGINGYNAALDDFPPDNEYRVVIYKVAMAQAVRGCANESCAEKTYDFPTFLPTSGGSGRFIGPSSLAAGHIGGNGYLAVGMTDGGVYVLNTALAVTGRYLGIATPDGSQTVPTTMAWDPSGSGLLAVGVLEWAYSGFFPTFNSAGQLTGDKVWTFQSGEGLVPLPLSSAVFQKPDGTTVVGFGMSDGNLRLLDPTVTGNSPLAVSNDNPAAGGMTAISLIPRFNTAVSGGPDLAVSYQNGNDTLTGNGGLFRWDGLNTLSHLPIAPGGGSYLSRDAYRTWFPGTKQGRITITNTSGEPLDVQIQSDPGAGNGCWWAPAWADAGAFPDKLTVQPGTTSPGTPSPGYTIGMLTGGDNGNCGAGDPTGTKRAYLVVSPSDRPADQQIAELQLDSTLHLQLKDHAGSGSTTIGTPTKGAQYGAIGAWNIAVGTSAAPTPTAAPVVAVRQLTPGASAKDNLNATSAVYKLTVQPMTWTVPDLAAGQRLQVVLPPLTVQGLDADEKNPITIGTFMPIGAVKTNPTAGTVTTSGGTFYWENTDSDGQTASYAYLRIIAGPVSDTNPNQVDVALTAGTPSQTWTVGANGLSFSAAGSGPFAANGVDALPLSVGVTPDKAISSDPTQNVYYRADKGVLVTNLYLAGDETSFFGIQPSTPAYPNTGGGRPATGSSFDYAVSATPTTTNVRAKIWGGTPNVYVMTSALPITPSAMSIGLGQGSASGFTLQSCTPVSCGGSVFAAVGPDSNNNPHAALYQAGPMDGDSLSGPPLTGVLVNSLAVIDADDSLPMTWTATSSQSLETSSVTLTTSTNSMKVDKLNNFPGGTKVSVPVVSRGLTATVTPVIPQR